MCCSAKAKLRQLTRRPALHVSRAALWLQWHSYVYFRCVTFGVTLLPKAVSLQHLKEKEGRGRKSNFHWVQGRSTGGSLGRTQPLPHYPPRNPTTWRRPCSSAAVQHGGAQPDAPLFLPCSGAPLFQSRRGRFRSLFRIRRL